MFGHWEKQTRKLNKHYQKAGRGQPVLLWGCKLLNCGGMATMSGYNYGITMDKDGIHLGGGLTSDKGRIDIGRTSIINLQGNILPLWYIMCDNITVDGLPFPDLTGKTLSDSTGKLKWKYDNVTLTYTFSGQTRTWTGRVILIYIDVADVPMYSQYVTDYMTFYDVKFNYPYIRTQSQTIRYGITNNNLFAYEDDASNYYTASAQYEKTFSVDPNTGSVLKTPPAIGSGFVFSSSPISARARDPFMGSYGVEMYDFNAQSQFSYGIIDRYGDNATAVYDNFYIWNTGVATLSITGFNTVEISDNNGLYFDYMFTPDIDLTGLISPNGATQTHVVGWQ